jgi:beta-glucosidase
VEAARESQVAILVAGGKSGLTKDSTSGELRDRTNLGLPGDQDKLVRAVLQAGTPVIIVLVDGRPAAIPELVEDAGAVLEAWLPGEQGAQAVADVLFGDYNPGGKLPISFPRTSGEVPIFARHKPSGGMSYNFIDYVDSSSQPLFPFGHGLSYTTFEYKNLKILPENSLPEGVLNISVEIANTGQRAGDEVIQLYLRDVVASVTRPVQELAGFLRIHLEAGEVQEVLFMVDVAQLAFYDLEMDYVIEPGFFEVMVGSSAQDIELRGQFEITGKKRIMEKKVFFAAVSLRQLVITE